MDTADTRRLLGATVKHVEIDPHGWAIISLCSANGEEIQLYVDDPTLYPRETLSVPEPPEPRRNRALVERGPA